MLRGVASGLVLYFFLSIRLVFFTTHFFTLTILKLLSSYSLAVSFYVDLINFSTGWFE